MYVVYKITFPNGKVYVGQTDNLERRKKLHQSSLNKIGYLIRQLGGRHKVEWEVLKEVRTREAAMGLEIAYIARFKANDPKYGYNTSKGGFFDKAYADTKKPARKPSSHVDWRSYLRRRYGLVIKKGARDAATATEGETKKSVEEKS